MSAVDSMLALVPRIAIGDIGSRGIYHVNGRIRAIAKPLKAPLTGTKCVYYSAKVDGIFAPIREMEATDFLIEDDSGAALVYMQFGKYEVQLVPSPIYWHPDGTPPTLPAPVVLVEFLRRHNRSDAGSHRFVEATLVEGDEIALVGPAGFELDTATGDPYRSTPGRLVFRATEDDSLYILGRP